MTNKYNCQDWFPKAKTSYVECFLFLVIVTPLAVENYEVNVCIFKGEQRILANIFLNNKISLLLLTRFFCFNYFTHFKLKDDRKQSKNS